MNPLPDRQYILDHTDILAVIGEYLPLRCIRATSGQSWVACCPFHDDSAWQLWVDQEKPQWGCYRCGHGGDVADFVSRYERITPAEAVGMLARRR